MLLAINLLPIAAENQITHTIGLLTLKLCAELVMVTFAVTSLYLRFHEAS